MIDMPSAAAQRVGFVGLGVMGQPMALNLQRSGVELTVWNRTGERCAPVVAAGATQAASLDALFGSVRTVILMLADEQSTDEVIGRGGEHFGARVAGKRIIVMGTNSPAWSERLAGDLLAAGADYVEAPVSGSRQPAVDANLVAMVAAADAGGRSEAAALISPMCQRAFDAGPVPGALRLKLAVNLYLITMVAGLAEAAALASALGVDWPLLRSVLDAGPMASDVSRTKLGKLIAQDFSVQASIRDVLKNCGLVAEAAQAAGLETPLLTHSMQLFDWAHRDGLGGCDMIGVIDAIRSAPPAAASVIARQLAAYNARDLDRFMECWHDDATFGMHPGAVRFRGAGQIREHHRGRFEDRALKAVLLSRTVVSDVVVDHEWVTRSSPGGPSHFEVLAIYTVADGRIADASFKEEERGPDPQGSAGTAA